MGSLGGVLEGHLDGSLKGISKAILKEINNGGLKEIVKGSLGRFQRKSMRGSLKPATGLAVKGFMGHGGGWGMGFDELGWRLTWGWGYGFLEAGDSWQMPRPPPFLKN